MGDGGWHSRLAFLLEKYALLCLAIVAGSELYGVLATVALELVVVLCYCLARLLFGREP